MRTHRIVLTGALALAASGLTAADAAPPRRPAPACLQVTDAQGDARIFEAFETPSLDIVSADIATGPRALVAVVRTRASEPEPVLVGGRTFLWEWTVGGVRQRLQLLEFDTKERRGSYDPNVGNNDTTDVIPVAVFSDAGSSSVTWVVPRKNVPALQKRGAKFTAMTVTAGDGRNISATGTTGRGFADDATSGKSYTDMTPTCVKNV